MTLWQGYQEYTTGKGQSLQQMMLGKLDIHKQKNKVRPLSYNIHQCQLKIVRDLNMRHETVKLLEENIGGKLHDIPFGSDVMTMTPKHKLKTAFICVRWEVGVQWWFYMHAQVFPQHLLKGPSFPHCSAKPL